MSTPKKRARTARRQADRDVVKHAAAARKVHLLGPGGAPDRPIELASAAQVEPDAEGQRCPVCGAGVRVESHDAVAFAGVRLRVAELRCKACHEKLRRYYRIGPVLN